MFIQNLEALRNPIGFLIPRSICSARAYVRSKLDQAAKDEAYGSESQGFTLFRHLASLYEAHEVPTAGFTDCHLVAIVGLLSNVINIVAWAMCHIVADKKLKASLEFELHKVVNRSSGSPDNEGLDLRLDLDKVKDSCPLLLATWYELLRIYGDSPVARYVQADTAFDTHFRVRRGSIMMTPIHLHNFDAKIWGSDVNAFRPNRFLWKDNGMVDTDLIKHLEVFGLPGMHQCPGRYLAMNLTLAFVAKALLNFEILPAPGLAFAIPNRKDTMLGLPATESDPRVSIGCYPGVRSVFVDFEKLQPGW